MSNLRVALVLQGLVGGIKGKNCLKGDDSDKVIELAYKHNKENILDVNENVDVFFHSWSTEHEDTLTELYEPKAKKFEKQIKFDVPDYIKADEMRKQSHFSRWYSFRESMKLVEEQSENYDYVLIQRFDLCWNVSLDFSTYSAGKLYVGGCSLDPSRELSDRWFFGGQITMSLFSSMYDRIPDYMKPGQFDSKKQYKGISSHSLTRYHVDQLGIPVELKYNYGEVDRTPNDYSEVRRMYYKDRT